MAFHFRHFTVIDHRSTLRVGTDAMLLGSWANPGEATRLLDIGTGCGVLALMMAQKCNGQIDAVEIDHASAEQAKLNFTNSPWHDRLRAYHQSIQDFVVIRQQVYDFIISNPPYFQNSLKSTLERRNIAKHDTSLTLNELLKISVSILKPGGILAIIIPVEISEQLIKECLTYGLHTKRALRIIPKAGVAPIRDLLELVKGPASLLESGELTIRDQTGMYSDEYLSLTGSYHNF